MKNYPETKDEKDLEFVTTTRSVVRLFPQRDPVEEVAYRAVCGRDVIPWFRKIQMRKSDPCLELRASIRRSDGALSKVKRHNP